jgi:hypothetical protein
MTETIAVDWIRQVETLLGTNPNWVLPALILSLKFFAKWLIGERPSIIRFWQSLLQLPVDIGFLAISLLVALIVAPKGSAFMPFVVFLIYVILVLISVAFWKLSPEDVSRRSVVVAAVVLMFNVTLTGTMLAFSIRLLV